MLLVLIRAVFVLVIAGLGVRTREDRRRESARQSIRRIHRRHARRGRVVVVDLLTPRKRIQTISAIYIGLIVGIFLTDLLQRRAPADHAALSRSHGST